MKFGAKHYVPIMKTKAGERWAIDRVPAAQARHLTPLFEIHRHKRKDEESQACDICEDLSSVWYPSHPCFIDTCWLQDDVGDPALIAATFECARNLGMTAIPVARLAYDEDALGVIADIHGEDQRGLLLRITPDEAESHDAIDFILETTGVDRTAAHLLVDYRHYPMQLTALLPELPDIANWRTFTVASGAFPRSLAGLPLDEWHTKPRHDWASWDRDVSNGRLPRKPAFGDYLTRDPGASPDGGRPSVNIKYTRDNDWQVRVGGKFGEGHAPDMYGICADLVEQDWYSGDEFSAGDAMISQVAEETVGPGAPQQWVQWGMSHHLMYVVDQIQNHPAL